jgi:serine protease Do
MAWRSARAVLVCVCLAVPGSAARAEGVFWTNAPHRRAGAGPTTGFAELAERARAAVVHVRGDVVTPAAAGGGERSGGDADSEVDRTSIGTGFLISRDGYVLTNEHVVRDVADLRVRLYDGRELAACVAGADSPTDLALLKIESKRPFPVLPLGDSDAVRVGEPVMAIGNPYGFNHSVTAGIVSAKERVVDRSTLNEPHDEDIYSFFIQTDASINLGNSGGPLIDEGGAVIAVSAAFWAGHPLQPAQGIGFAIPINIAKALLPRLAREGAAHRSFLGVDAQPIDPALEAALHLPNGRGALIASIEKGSPAEAAGLEPGDVVVAWNGAPVATSEDLKIDAQLSIPGGRAKIAVVRDGRRLEREATLRASVVKNVAPPHPSSCAHRREEASASIEDFDVTAVPPKSPSRAAGIAVTVSRVTDHSAAAAAGLKVGDGVLRIGKVRVRTEEDVKTAMGSYKMGEAVAMLVRRSGFDFWLAFPRR